MKKALSFLIVLAIGLSACGPSKAEQAQKLVDQAGQLVNNDKYTDAISLYDQALALDPNSSAAYAGRGSANRLSGNLDQAMSDEWQGSQCCLGGGDIGALEYQHSARPVRAGQNGVS